MVIMVVSRSFASVLEMVLTVVDQSKLCLAP